MMEIPKGKRCGKCPMLQYDSDDCLYYCNCPKFKPDGPLQDVLVGTNNWKPLRWIACLAAYPNGATIEIKAREVHG